jgi:hypothetical protein
MTRQAVEAFRAQTYPDKRLLIWDTGSDNSATNESSQEGYCEGFIDAHRRGDGAKVGELRNRANGMSGTILPKSDIICHWDSDDWSHPNRIAEQVALLQSSGAECVGYNEMLFWRETPQVIKDQYAEVLRRYPTDPNVPIPQHLRLRDSEAWLYTNRSATWALGTSLCYWRRTWERAPFSNTYGIGADDTDWFNRVKCFAVPSINPISAWLDSDLPRPWWKSGAAGQPRMVARIHAGNAGNSAYWPAEMAKAPHHWRRVPEWDGYCRKVFA